LDKVIVTRVLKGELQLAFRICSSWDICEPPKG